MESQNSNSEGILSAHRLWGHTREGSGNTRTAGTARAEVWGWFGNVALYRYQKKSHPDGQNPGTFTGVCIYIYTCIDIHTDTHIYIYTICIFQWFKKVGNFGRAELIERIASDLGCCSLIFPNDFTLMCIYIYMYLYEFYRQTCWQSGITCWKSRDTECARKVWKCARVASGNSQHNFLSMAFTSNTCRLRSQMIC